MRQIASSLFGAEMIAQQPRPRELARWPGTPTMKSKVNPSSALCKLVSTKVMAPVVLVALGG
jgi:hypothetical protein